MAGFVFETDQERTQRETEESAAAALALRQEQERKEAERAQLEAAAAAAAETARREAQERTAAAQAKADEAQREVEKLEQEANTAADNARNEALARAATAKARVDEAQRETEKLKAEEDTAAETARNEVKAKAAERETKERDAAEKARQEKEKREEEDRQVAKKREDYFRNLLATVYGTSAEDCVYDINGIASKDDIKSWLGKFNVASGTAVPKGTGDVLHAELALPGGHTVKGIKISHNAVHGDLKNAQNHKDMLLSSFTIALAAKAHEGMRTKGAKLVGNTELEKIMLLIAAEMVGLPITNAAPDLVQKAAAVKQQIQATAIWAEFTALVQQAPHAKTREESLTSIFNRTELPANVKTILSSKGISEDIYRAFSQAVIKGQGQDGTARAEELKKAKESLKGNFKITDDNVKDIVKAMDADGITSCEPGKARTVNYDTQGVPKPAAN